MYLSDRDLQRAIERNLLVVQSLEGISAPNL
jgi:hypothetical protein